MGGCVSARGNGRRWTMKEICIDIEADGSWSIDVTGVEGKECKELTAGLEQALGKVTEAKEKPELRRAQQTRGKGVGHGR